MAGQRPFLLRRTREEVLMELPPLTESIVEVTLSPDERAFYEVLRRRALVNLAGTGTAGGPCRLPPAWPRPPGSTAWP